MLWNVSARAGPAGGGGGGGEEDEVLGGGWLVEVERWVSSLFSGLTMTNCLSVFSDR